LSAREISAHGRQQLGNDEEDHPKEGKRGSSKVVKRKGWREVKRILSLS